MGVTNAAAPLYVGGRRRVGRNLWGFDPFEPQLEPPQRADDAHHVNRTAYAFWTDPDTLRQRERLVHQFARRKRRGTRAEPIRRRQGTYAAGDLEVRKRSLYQPGAEGALRLLAWCAWHVDWRTGRVGLWRDGQIHYQSRANIAERSGFPVRVDSKRRVRADRLDRRIEDAIAAGLLWRHEEVKYCRTTLKVTRLFWIVSGAQKLREIYGKRLKDEAARAAEKKRAAYQREKAERRGEQQQPEHVAFVGGLAAASTNDTDFTDPAVRRGWPPRKPPS
jgi:hypothetical protein